MNERSGEFSVGPTPTDAPGDVPVRRRRLTGIDLIRTIAVVAVLYSHISYYFIDDRGEGWWVIDVVYRVFVEGLELNNHLSFVGVGFFMVLTGLLITGSVTRRSPGMFLANRIGRLLPLLWVSVAAAILLVRLGVNGMFSGQQGISNVEAALSFVLGGFFLKPEVAVLGVTWTLLAQIAFYLYCTAARPLLRRAPIAVPMLGAALCAAVLLYNHYVPQVVAVPVLSKLAATMPAVFAGQLLYFAWQGLANWRWLLAGAFAQIAVVRLARDLGAYWAGDRYLWTIVVVTAVVVLLADRDGIVARSRAVHWVGTRSYAIYLLHTLILYRVFENTVAWFGTTGAIVAFLAVTAFASEVSYRFIEVPSGRWIAARFAAPRAPAARSPDAESTKPTRE